MVVKTVVMLTVSDVRDAILKQIYAEHPNVRELSASEIDIEFNPSQNGTECTAVVKFAQDKSQQRMR